MLFIFDRVLSSHPRIFFMRILLTALCIFSCSLLIAQPVSTRFEKSNGTESPGYFEIIDWWKKLDDRSGKIKMMAMGMTDAGLPLHLIVVSNNGDYNFTNLRKNKRIILINNGIHPGEPDGIDASMLLFFLNVLPYEASNE